MAEQQDNAQRTEEPTFKRLEDARKKGDSPKSQEVTATAFLLAGAFGLWFLSGGVARGVTQAGIGFLDHPHLMEVDGAGLVAIFNAVGAKLGVTLFGFALLMMVAAISGNFIQAKPVFTTHRMKPELGKLSPLKGLKRIFGPAGLVNFLKGFGKLLLVGAIMVYALWPQREMMINLVYAQDLTVMLVARNIVLKLFVLTIVVMSIIAALDYGWQFYSWKQRLRMTREEVRREQKDSEGDPQIKARRRQLRDVAARRRITSNVKNATVLIMNPTHYAVALHYDGAAADKPDAPVCTAKGRDELALRMRQIAREHNVPVVENPPLARALHAEAALDRMIPIEHYEAVAKVIGFVLMKKRPARPPTKT